jgi:hypothetical protein
MPQSPASLIMCIVQKNKSSWGRAHQRMFLSWERSIKVKWSCSQTIFFLWCSISSNNYFSKIFQFVFENFQKCFIFFWKFSIIFSIYFWFFEIFFDIFPLQKFLILYISKKLKSLNSKSFSQSVVRKIVSQTIWIWRTSVYNLFSWTLLNLQTFEIFSNL